MNLNLNINRSNTRTKNNPIKKELSLEGNIIHSNTKIKNDKNKSDILKLKNFFFPVGNIKSENTTIKNTKNDNDDIEEQSYAFQNLINLNKDKSANEQIYSNKIIDEEISYNNHEKNKKKKNIENANDKNKFILNESKKYFNDDKQEKENNEIRKNSDSFKSQLKLDFPSNKKKEHKSLKFNQARKKQDLFEYDGDMETITLRDSYKKQIEKNNTYDINNFNEDKNQNHSPRDRIRVKAKEINNNQISSNANNLIFKKEKEKIEIIEPRKISMEKKSENKLSTYPTLCEGIIVSGIPTILTEDKIIHDSSDFLSTCGHKICSSLNSINPEILFFYKKEELNLSEDKIKNIANLSFSTGVKICLESKLEKNKMRNLPQQIVLNIIQNDSGEILYLSTIYHYNKLTPNEFIEMYNNDISIFYSELFKKTNLKKNDIFQHVFIPESITLISHYPFFNSIEICLHGFLSPYLLDRVNLLNHIIHEVPIPCNNEQIKFFILLFSTPVILNHKMNLYKVLAISNKEKQIYLLNNNYLSTEGIDYNKLFSNISLEHIIFLFSMILLEQKILFVHKDYEKLSNIIFIFNSLIFPFSWINNLFPIISLDMINTLQKKTHFIAGMDESLFAYINKNNIKIGNDVIIYNISLNSFISSKNMKKTSRKDLLNEYKLFTLPEKVTNFLIKELKIIVKEINSNLNLYIKFNNQESKENYSKIVSFKQHIEFETKLIFIKSISMLIDGIDNYTFYTEEKALFNKEAFIEKHKDKDFRNFLCLFVNTNLFNDFIEEQKNIYFSEIKNFSDDIHIEKNKYSKEEINLDIFYFNKIVRNFKEPKNNNRNRALNLTNIITNDIEIKAENICKNLKLINETINELKNNNNDTDDINLNNQNQELLFRQKNKTNILLSGKNYLEDKINDKKKSINNNMTDFGLSHHIKESKLSTESTTINTLNKYLNKLDYNEEKSKTSISKNILLSQINKNYTNNKKKNEKMKKYLLSPYFLNNKSDDEFYIKELKDEQIILKEINEFKNKKNIKEKFPPFTSMIYRNLRPIEFNNYLFKKDKIYILNNRDNNMNIHYYNRDTFKNKFNDELYSFKKIFYKNKKNENEIMNFKELMANEDKIIIINKLFKYCFEQKMELKEIYIPYIQKIFSNIENLEYFANLIVPDNLLRLKNFQKQLITSSFNSFSKIIKIAFEHINLTDKNLGFLLTLSCFFYYKIDKDKIIYLYNDFLFNKLDKTQKPYQLWCNEIFWIEFFHTEFESMNKEIDYEFNDNANSDEEKNDINKTEIFDLNKNKKMCLIKSVIILGNIMLKLNIDKNFVKNIIEKMILPVFVNDFYFINEIMNLTLLANKSI